MLYVDAPAPERIWPPECFAELADHVIEKWNATVAVVSGREGSGLTEKVKAASRNPERLLRFTDLTIPQLAALIASSRLLVANDTGPMHIGPAVGTPTLGLFSVGFPEHFRPIGQNDRFLRANPIEKIEVKDVLKVMEEMWARAMAG